MLFRFDAPGRPEGTPWVDRPITRIDPPAAVVSELAARVRSQPRGFLVFGAGARVSPAAVAAFTRLARGFVGAVGLGGVGNQRCIVGTRFLASAFRAFATRWPWWALICARFWAFALGRATFCAFTSAFVAVASALVAFTSSIPTTPLAAAILARSPRGVRARRTGLAFALPGMGVELAWGSVFRGTVATEQAREPAKKPAGASHGFGGHGGLA